MNCMSDVPVWRLYVLRAAYLLLVVGVGLMVWPLLLNHDLDWPRMNSVVCAMLGTVAVLSLIGLRHPLQMLPVLMFELAWKAIWLVTVALPLWRADAISAPFAETIRDSVIGVIVMMLAIPWPHVFRQWIARKGDRWR